LLNGWLSPNGEWFPCKFKDHLDLAEKIEENLNIKLWDEKRNIPFHGESLLEKLGFIKIVGTDYTDQAVFFPEIFYRDTLTTKNQINWLLDNQEKMSNTQFDYVTKHIEYWME